MELRAQEQFWRGPFGDEYNDRSPGNEEANYRLFKRTLMGYDIRSAVELGAGTGANLRAIHRLRPMMELAAVEINEAACERLTGDGSIANVYNTSLLEWEPTRAWDLAFTKGVLIHIAPDDLPKAYATLVKAAYRYILIAEYHNPTPVEIPYRGHGGVLWKRDFAAELLNSYPLRLCDYGFVSRLDKYPQDDLTWFLMEKK